MVNLSKQNYPKKLSTNNSRENIIQKFYPDLFYPKCTWHSTSLYMNNFPTLHVTYITFICVDKHLQILLMSCENAQAYGMQLKCPAYNSWPSHLSMLRCHRQGRPVQPKAQAATGWATGLAGAARLKSELDCHWCFLVFVSF